MKKNDYPSVTEVLGLYTDFSIIPEATLAQATERGSEVHKICAAIAQRIWMPIPPEYEGYALSFQAWFDTQVKQVLAVEDEFIDRVYGFKGHPDLIVEIPEGIVVVDNKTPITLQKVWAAQLAAYLHLAKKYKPKKAGTLRLNADGKIPKMKWYQDSNADVAAFLNALNAYKYFS